MATIEVRENGLTDDQAEIIRQTLPVVGANIGEITPNFYRRMFAAHPELIADTFNRGNQKQGAQQKALAASVAHFAATLVDPEAPDPVDLLQRIGHKHVSVGIAPEQYPIVHRHLFDAIEEILTPEVFQGAVREAWDAVYVEMERVLIEYEKGVYGEMGVAPGDVFRSAKVVEREELGDDVVKLVVELDGDAPVSFAPGQYISVRQTMPDGARQLRQYSLINAGDSVTGRGRLAFAVRRVDAAGDLPAGEVSTQIFRDVKVGDEIEVSLPAGDLVLDLESDAPVVLISAGIGATPMIGMLAALVEGDSDRAVQVLHADRSPAADAFREDRKAAVEKLSGATVREWYEPDLMDLSDVDIPDDAEVYICGGNGFLQAVRAQLAEKGVGRDRVHFELFSPNDWLLDG